MLILVNNAGITRDGLIAMMKEEDFDKVIAVNLKGAFNMIRHTAGLFIRNREGCIINIASVAGIMGNAGQCNYAASKDNPLIKMIPLGRMGRAEDVAEAAGYLATAEYVTGEVLRVDGGIAM